MALTRILSLVVPLVLLAPVAGVVEAASAATTTATATGLSVTGKPRLGIYHDEIGPDAADVVRHRGRLTTADGDPVDGATVHLERKLAGDVWRTFDDGEVTDSDGRYEFTSFVEGNAVYRVSYDGDGVFAPTVSEPVRLKAMRDFNAQLVEKKEKAVLKGRINPDWDNKTVTWVKRTCKSCAWKAVDSAKSGDNGSWKFDAGYPPLGKTWYYRAVVPKTSEFVESYSAKLVTTTTPSRTSAARR